MILPFSSSCQHRHIDQHILGKDPVARGGVIDQDVGHGADELAVLNDRAARQVCGQLRTTSFIAATYFFASCFKDL